MGARFAIIYTLFFRIPIIKDIAEEISKSTLKRENFLFAVRFVHSKNLI